RGALAKRYAVARAAPAQAAFAARMTSAAPSGAEADGPGAAGVGTTGGGAAGVTAFGRGLWRGLAGGGVGGTVARVRVVFVERVGVAVIEEVLQVLHGDREAEAFAEDELHVGDADHLAAGVEEGAAAVAGIDLGGGLDVDEPLEVAVAGADDAAR